MSKKLVSVGALVVASMFAACSADSDDGSAAPPPTGGASGSGGSAAGSPGATGGAAPGGSAGASLAGAGGALAGGGAGAPGDGGAAGNGGAAAGGEAGAGGAGDGGAGGCAPVCKGPELGDYLVSCVLEVMSFDPKLALRFWGKLEAGDTPNSFSLELTPLQASATKLGQTTGAAQSSTSFTVDDACGFVSELGTVEAPGDANGATGSSQKFDMSSLKGNVTAPGALCGELSAKLVLPFDYDLVTSKGDICLLRRCEGGAECPLPTLVAADYVCAAADPCGAGGAAGAGGS